MASSAPQGAKGRLCSLLIASGCDRRTSQGKAEGFTARAGGWTRRPGALTHPPPSVPSRGEPSPWGHPRRGGLGGSGG